VHGLVIRLVFDRLLGDIGDRPVESVCQSTDGCPSRIGGANLDSVESSVAELRELGKLVGL
jgi:hypothetical protein